MTLESTIRLRRSLRPRFSLKLLYLLLTLVAGYFGYSLHRHNREQEALKAITAAGGEYGEQRTYVFYPFVEMHAVSFQDRKFDDDRLREVVPHLAQLPGLVYLQFVRTGITDDGIGHLASVPKLEKLDVWDMDLTDASVTTFQQFPSLTELDLGGTMISDDGAAKLANVKRLRKLNLPHGPTSMTTPGTLADDLYKMGDQLVEMQSIPGMVSQRAADALATELPKCTVTLDKMWFYSGDRSRAMPTQYDRQSRQSE